MLRKHTWPKAAHQVSWPSRDENMGFPGSKVNTEGAPGPDGREAYLGQKLVLCPQGQRLLLKGLLQGAGGPERVRVGADGGLGFASKEEHGGLGPGRASESLKVTTLVAGRAGGAHVVERSRRSLTVIECGNLDPPLVAENGRGALPAGGAKRVSDPGA